jgi:DNA-directed RNA polymerase subunit RPC12/RpoP
MFKKRNESFVCINCGKIVRPHPFSSRDHCNFCLVGLHVDKEPGDRENECKGILEPVGIRKRYGKEQIAYRCQKCKAIVYCVFAPDDSLEVKIELILVES